MIKVLHPGIYSLVQDQGRFGYAKMGIPVSGAMDSYSAEIGAILLKNKKSDAAIEITFGGAKFEFFSDALICITGADFSPKINEEPVEMMTVHEIKKGSILSFGKRKYGVRTYLNVQGGIQSDKVLKSRSYFKGITPQFHLKKGDELSILPKKSYANHGFSTIKVLEELFVDEQLECYPGPEFDQLNEKQLKQLFEFFVVSPENNRVGYRLHETLENSLKPILTSSVLPGTVQLTPSGKLIVLMRDCQVTGGYPRVLQLSEWGICKLSQKFTGDKVRFSLKNF